MLSRMSLAAGVSGTRHRRLAVRLTSLALVVVLVASCAGPGPSGSASSSGARASSPPFEPGPIAAIDGANLLVRGVRGAKPAASADELKAIAAADAEFALDLFRKLAAESDENIVIGPHSIWTALAMVWAGARGETATEMADVLQFDRPQDEVTPLLNALDLALLSRNDPGTVDLRIANQLFAQPGLPLVEDYLTTMTRDFGAPIAELDFADGEAARKIVNDWVADRTNDRITELFPPGAIDASTLLVLCNAMSMDAAWTYLFDPAATTLSPFTLSDGTVISVPTMHFGLYLPLTYGDGYAAVELPYGKGDLSMIVFQHDDLDGYIRDMKLAPFRGILDAITEQGIHLELPKFSFGYDVGLKATLQDMGIRSAFQPSADFSGMTGSAGLFVSSVQHEAFIEVDEEGTEAHAATGVSMAASHGPTITFDEPFLFVIRDRATGAILFMGRVTNPLLA